MTTVKEFEIEEGERSKIFENLKIRSTLYKNLQNISKFAKRDQPRSVNVNRMSPEDMKHHEMIMEKRFRQQSNLDDEDREEDGRQGYQQQQVRVSL